MAGLALLPLGYLVVRTADIGRAQVWEIVSSDRVRELFGNTLALAVAVTVTSVAVAVPVAWVTARTDVPFRRFWVVATALPLAIPTYVGGYALVAAVGPRGTLQGWLEPFGVESLPDVYGFRGAWLALSLFTYPYVLLTVRAGVRRLDPSLEEASRTLGRSAWSTMWRVVLPQLRPSIVAGSLLVGLYTLSDFGAVSMLRYDSFTRAIFLQYRASLDRSAAAVLGLCLVAISLAVLSGQGVLRGRHQVHGVHAGTRRVAPVQPLGRWRWPVCGALGGLVLVALVLPMAVVFSWFLRGLGDGEPVRLTTELVGNSLRSSALGAVASVVAAWPVAILSVRRGGWFGRLVEGACWVGHSLPGVVIALALVFFGARQVPALYQTHWMLTLAYVVLFLPQALGAIRSALLQVSPTLEQASRTLGVGPTATVWRIVVPLVRPGLLAGGSLVFLTCMKELPATLLLAPTGHATLATQVWTATSEAFFARAALPALALVLLSSLPLAVIALRERSS